jgi:hypothetical protein
VAPVDLNMALRNIAIERGIRPPDILMGMARNVIESGFTLKPVNVVTRDFEEASRGSLNLPDYRGPKQEFHSAIIKNKSLLAAAGL